MLRLFLSVLLIFCFVFSGSAKGGKSVKGKNVIIIIGDGCGFNQIAASDYYMYGKEGEQVYQKFPVKFAVSTYPSKTGSYPSKLKWAQGYNPLKAWESYEYLKDGYTESAASSTAMATGVKTYNNSIGMSIDYKPLKNLSETAKELGKSAGVVTSVPFSHATPAGFVAHQLTRSDYRNISKEMILDSKMDVIMGTGHPYYNDDGVYGQFPKSFQYVGDSLTWHYLVSGKTHFKYDTITKQVQDIDGDKKPDSWTFIQEANDFRKMMTGKTPKRVFGVPKVFNTLQETRSGDVFAEPFAVPLNKDVPTLAEMSLAAINVLDNNKKGFFLMIEGGAIDWASHDGESGRLIEEMISFNNTIDSVVKWIERNSNWDETILIVTADHETGLLWGPPKEDGEKYFNPIVNNGKGKLPGMVWNTGDHSNSLVPLYAKGAGTELFEIFADENDRVRGRYLNNSEIPQIVRLIWNK